MTAVRPLHPLHVVVRRRLAVRLPSMAGVEVTAHERGAFVGCPHRQVAWQASRILRDEGFKVIEDSTLLIVEDA